MPVSKHRRKPGGKSMRHPGKRKTPAIPPWLPETQAWRRFRNGYTVPFFAATEGHEGHTEAHDVLGIIAEHAWQYNAPLKAVSKAEILREMAEPIEDLYPGQTTEQTERALAFLVEQGMVEIEGDEITVPARFQQVDKAG
jgi:hypothetical protein